MTKYRFPRADGQLDWVKWEIRPWHEVTGEIGGIILFSEVITAHKQAEKALRETSERLSHMLANSPTVIYALKVEGRKVIPDWISDNINTILGFSAADGLQAEWWPQQIYPEDRSEVLASLEHLFDDFYQHEYRFVRKDGRVIWLHDEHRVLRDTDQNPWEIIGAWTDITARKQAEDALKEYNTRLETAVEARTNELRDAQEKLMRQEKLAVLGQLAGGVGHELRNPLAVISNAVYYLKLVGIDSNEKVKEYLGIIQTETRTAEKIITDLLDFARVKSVDCEPASVSELIHQTLERFPAPPFIDVTLKIPSDLPKVFVDPRQMIQVLGNLTVNACQAMTVPSGPNSTTGVLKSGYLTISASVKNDFIAIAIQDTGVGILPDNMKKLFEPLFTTKAKGIGLGLAVSQKLAEANGGRIEARSEAGKGSTFTIFLPIKVETRP